MRKLHDELDDVIGRALHQQNTESDTLPGVLTHYIVLAVESKYDGEDTNPIIGYSHLYSNGGMPDWQRIGLLESYLALFGAEFVEGMTAG